ncbi:TetR/AcrR family transcriptional regulator [Flindersiella endophytica]
MGSIRESKQRRARDAIIDAAHELFAERGFDDVSVTDIAERAGVGRTTFFRYFGDKQEVVFAEGEDLALDIPLTPATQIGASLSAALAHARALVTAYLRRITEHPDRYTLHEQLVERHPELQARNLVKQRRLAAGLARRLSDDGAEPATAVMAAELGLACYYAGRDFAGNEPRRLIHEVDGAFGRLIGSLPGPSGDGRPRRKRAASA